MFDYLKYCGAIYVIKLYLRVPDRFLSFISRFYGATTNCRENRLYFELDYKSYITWSSHLEFSQRRSAEFRGDLNSAEFYFKLWLKFSASATDFQVPTQTWAADPFQLKLRSRLTCLCNLNNGRLSETGRDVEQYLRDHDTAEYRQRISQ